MTQPIQETLPAIVRQLRKPAGDDPRFATLEGIRANRTQFVSLVHKCWKGIHEYTLDELLRMEYMLSSDVIERLPPDFPPFLKRMMAVWRRVNDSLVWSVLAFRGHEIRMLCLRKERPALKASNPKSIRGVLDDFNKDPLTFALWTDATSCVDMGDVLCRSFSDNPNGLLEVKEGKVNDQILDLILSDANIETKVSQIDDFVAVHGKKGLKQLNRVSRQIERLNQATSVLREDAGIHPYFGEQVRLRDVPTHDASYDNTLAELIQESAHRRVVECIDRCLWVFIDRVRASATNRASRSFRTRYLDAHLRSGTGYGSTWIRTDFYR